MYRRRMRHEQQRRPRHRRTRRWRRENKEYYWLYDTFDLHSIPSGVVMGAALCPLYSSFLGLFLLY